jgi:serine/threonine-protein kinase
MAEILHYIHYEALADYRPIEKAEDASERVGILHRDVKPANIVYQGDEKNTLFLLDFGVAKVAYTDKCMVYNNCGTSSYKAP